MRAGGRRRRPRPPASRPRRYRPAAGRPCRRAGRPPRAGRPVHPPSTRQSRRYPSIAAASKPGVERLARIGSAVTRPSARASAITSVAGGCRPPARRTASSQAASETATSAPWSGVIEAPPRRADRRRRGYGCGTMTRKREAPPPYSTAAVRVLRPSRWGGGRRPGRGRGAARAPHRRRAGRGDDADARARRGAGARVRALRGPAAARRPGAGRSRGEHDRARGARLRPRPAGALLLHDLLLRRLRQGGAGGDRRRVAAGRELTHASRLRSPGRCPRDCGSRRRRSPRPEGCTPRGSSRPTARSCTRARTSAGTTRWTR